METASRRAGLAVARADGRMCGRRTNGLAGGWVEGQEAGIESRLRRINEGGKVDAIVADVTVESRGEKGVMFSPFDSPREGVWFRVIT